MELFELGNNDKSNKLNYFFKEKIMKGAWKNKYKIICKLKGKEPISGEGLSDYEYFVLLNPLEDSTEEASKYYLVDGETPVTFITVTKGYDDLYDYVCSTPEEFSRRGYATLGLELIEKKLFSNPNVKGIRIIDLFSTGGATTKIAKKLKYMETEDEMCYVKLNPNYPQNELGIKNRKFM